MNVLIVGYGKIGRIKALTWASLGAHVRIFDTDSSKRTTILNDNFEVFNRGDVHQGIIDISTPAGVHFKALTWCLAQPKIDPSVILVEKPLASSKKELLSFVGLIQKRPELQDRIFLNESYYQSSALKYLQKHIADAKTSILSISIELSKNRLADNDIGRFFDKSLDVIGIEVPHALAILDMISPGSFFVDYFNSILQVDKSRYDNQASLLSTQNRTPAVTVRSYMGDYREGGRIAYGAESVIRILKVVTNESEYSVEFDPANGCERYCSKLTIHEHGNQVLEKVFDDNHLKNHMRLFMDDNNLPHLRVIGFENAVRSAERLIKLRDRSRIQRINVGSYNKQNTLLVDPKRRAISWQ